MKNLEEHQTKAVERGMATDINEARGNQNIDMKKLLGIICVLVLLGFLGQVYESASCKDRVEKLKLTGTEAEDAYKKCKSF